MRLVDERTLTDQALTDLLAERVMGWKASPDRFIKRGRTWLPKWRFAPFVRLEDAFELLDRSACTYTIERAHDGSFSVAVVFNGRTGNSSGEPKARSITFALARALGIAPEVNR
jgi:hypothetical protein